MKYWPVMLGLGLLAGCARFQPQPLSPGESAARLESRSLSSPELKGFLETNLNRRLPAWPIKSWDFELLTLAAFYYQPSLAVARATWEEASAGIVTAGARPNPNLGFTPQYVFNPGAEPPWVTTLNLDWPIETGGKRAARLAQARQLSESARLNIAATAWQVRSQLRVHVIELIAASRREAVLRRQTAVLQQMADSLQQQQEAGAVAASEVLVVRLRLQQAQLDLGDAQRLRVEARARVAEAIGVPLAALDGVEISYDLTSPPADVEALTSRELRSRALQHRADVLAALADYSASEGALQIEIAKQYPDLHLNTGYEYDQGLQKWGLIGFGVDLPLLNRNEGPIAEAEARRKSAAARFEALQSRVIADIDRSVAVYEIAARNQGDAQALLRTQQKQEQSVEQQLQAGAVARLDVLTAQLELSASELAVEDRQAQLHQALGALEDALQRPSVPVPDPAQASATRTKQEIP